MTLRFSTCSVPECGKPGVRAIGGCDSYNRQLCATHLSPSFHKCNQKAQTIAEVDRLRALITDGAVCKLASSLNGGRTCSVEHPPQIGTGSLMGCANYHTRIRFEDGLHSWLLRVPRVTSVATSLPDEFVAHLIRSEYATLKFLETTAVPAPRAFAYGVRGGGAEHGVGVGFILMEELPGRPWTRFGVSSDDATKEERAKVRKSVADILAELARHPFPAARPLLLAQESHVEYTAFAEQHLALVADGQLYAAYPVDAYLVYRFLKDNAWQLAEHDAGPQEFFLKHADDKGEHLLVVDENFNVTGIIDWQMARVVPRQEAFGASPVTASMSSLCRGKVSLSKDDVALAAALEERGSPELASCMVDEKARRFFWGLALEPKWSHALPLANAILEVFRARLVWEE
ncbi:hypothetical protein B0T26DRAFT_752759 [Lasiosphaeria miniovina]|uniref:Aminoglycoside phosphotransferase domain-containing protein n=1 Tax=Lasiosphaeria miniovina TaxID=1954250 RepID=A0AA40AAZ8_9PEZI|nr:uncharacterized protein B0T26DRAFT_752759 [Lasiosphaeria miniovina]KAK0712532.1 hypothetical protein B0T26DRAFT_752759 [Lasiosphaeria miniovina]